MSNRQRAGRLDIRSCGILEDTAVADEPTGADTKVVPIVAAKRGRPGTWHHAAVHHSVICLSGGFSRTPLTAKSIQYKMGPVMHVFVELDKNSSWFLKGAGGTKTRKGDLKSVQVLQELRDKFNVACGDVDGTETAVAGPDTATAVADEGDDDFDPMSALDEMVDTLQKQKRSQAKSSRIKHPERAMVQQLMMSTRPKCAACANDGDRAITVYRPGGGGSGAQRGCKGNLFLRVDCLDWLLSYAADELHYQGVVCESSAVAVEDPKIANTTAVADVHLEWDFGGKAWDAEFVAGQFEGQTIRFALSSFTRAIWTQLRDKDIVQNDISRNSMLKQKDAAKQLVTMWCQAIARSRSYEFKMEFNLLADEDYTPTKKKKKRRHDSNEPAVAVEDLQTAVAASSDTDDD